MDPVYIPYWGMFLSLVVAPVLTFGFIIILKKNKSDVEKLRYQKEMLEIQLKRDEVRLRTLTEENRKYDRVLESTIAKAIEEK